MCLPAVAVSAAVRSHAAARAISSASAVVAAAVCVLFARLGFSFLTLFFLILSLFASFSVPGSLDRVLAEWDGLDWIGFGLGGLGHAPALGMKDPGALPTFPPCCHVSVRPFHVPSSP